MDLLLDLRGEPLADRECFRELDPLRDLAKRCFGDLDRERLLELGVRDRDLLWRELERDLLLRDVALLE